MTKRKRPQRSQRKGVKAEAKHDAVRVVRAPTVPPGLPRAGTGTRTPIPNFNADAPPADWQEQHNAASFALGGDSNRITPRLASHHYASDRVVELARARARETATFVFA